MYVLESFGLGKVIDNNGPDGSSVISIGNGPESLLSGGIPNLVFNGFIFKMDSFGGKLHSNGGLWIHGEGVLYESGEQVSLAHTWITYHDYFVEEIELLLAWHCQILLFKLIIT